ncbi:hypothetical protein [Arthrobacter burdickii]|uniref:Uncharacterized protein n=1 Tax=Arthrobacter burdickii TaxID=3035920 RepID=A0ABT8K3U0_9MICC|nr:hypothetical protein [Arthrobacter burdickii]MDN4612115.1 hypothetical protein [Arthrobacter burdickii]
MSITKALSLPMLVAFSLAAGAVPASAAPEDSEPSRGGTHGFVPVPEEFYEPESYDVEACGSTVTIASGDVREVQYRVRVNKDGSTVVRFRGESTVDLTRKSDGAFIDELDVSGPFTQRSSADGQNAELTFRGASIIDPTDPTSAAGFAAAGLPYLFFFEHGKLTVQVEFSDDPTVMEPDSVEVVHSPRHVVDVCDMLDEAR